MWFDNNFGHLLYRYILLAHHALRRVNRSRRILQSTLGVLKRLLLGIRLATTLVLLLLRLDRLLALLSEEHLLVGLVLLVLAHQFVELLLSILNLRHQVLRGIPREPRANLADVEVVLGVAALKNLGEHLRLLNRGERATNLDTANIGAEINLVIVHLLKVLLLLEQEDLILLVDVRLLHLLLTNTSKVIRILHQVLDLQRILLGKECHKTLESLDLPLVVHPLHELLKEELILLLNHLLRTDEGDNTVLLRRDLRVLVEIINHAVLITLRKLSAGHLLVHAT